MEKIIKLPLIEIAEKIKEQQVTAQQLVEYFIAKIKKYNHKNAVLEVFNDAVIKAKEIDENIKRGKETRPLAGIPVLIKDNILYKGKKASCASKFLENFVSPYNATVVNKLIDSGCIIIGRTNMDEFAMGGSNENSVYGPCLNAFDDTCVAGGSSGGSTVAVALDMCCAALGTDTGGSVRQPSSFNGVVGMKPTYGRISRYGVVAYGSSLDQVGPITKSVKDNATLLKILAGKDDKDQTSENKEVPDYTKAITGNIKGLRIGICNELIDKIKVTNYYKKFNNLILFLKSKGAIIVNISIPNFELGLPVYYIISTAEAASNLGRFDGVKYTSRSKNAQNIEDIYKKSRTEGFGAEVKRRIMLGNYVLSSGYFDAYYKKAKKVQHHLIKSAKSALENCDALLFPTTFGEAFKIGEKTKNPVSMYLEDLFTVFANITGIPAISVPYDKGDNNLPLGVQILSMPFNEGIIYNVADFIEQNYQNGEVKNDK